MPCNEPVVVVELGLWSVLSTALVASSVSLRFEGQTTFSALNPSPTLLPIPHEISKTRRRKLKVQGHIACSPSLFSLFLHVQGDPMESLDSLCDK